jgi:lysophospholipase L1-like esterase
VKVFIRIIRWMAINAAVLLLLLALVELGLRMAGKDYGNVPTNADPRLNWVHPRDYRYTVFSTTGEFGGHTVYFDSVGRRAALPGQSPALPSSAPTLLFLGDSFTEAIQMPYDSCFTGRLAKSLTGTRVLNYGVTGYSPVLYYLQLQQLLAKPSVSPTAVVITLYANDVRDDSAALRRARMDKASGLITAIDGGEKNSLKAWLRQLYLVKNLNRIYRQWDYRQNAAEKPVTDFRKENYIEERPALHGTLTAEYLLHCKTLLEQRKIPLVVTVIPSLYKTVLDTAATGSFADQVRDWCQTAGIPYLDLERGFVQDAEQLRKQYFYPVDIHCTPAGHARIASLLEPTMQALLQ